MYKQATKQTYWVFGNECWCSHSRDDLVALLSTACFVRDSSACVSLVSAVLALPNHPLAPSFFVCTCCGVTGTCSPSECSRPVVRLQLSSPIDVFTLKEIQAHQNLRDFHGRFSLSLRQEGSSLAPSSFLWLRPSLAADLVPVASALVSLLGNQVVQICYPGSSSSPSRCSSCGSFGHFSRMCPNFVPLHERKCSASFFAARPVQGGPSPASVVLGGSAGQQSASLLAAPSEPLATAAGPRTVPCPVSSSSSLTVASPFFL